ncbi:MAG: Multidrug efflux pump subunit AcrB, partial [Candidatus Hinthialibacteria bacterium OLB16]
PEPVCVLHGLCLRHRLAFVVVSLSLLVSFSVYASMRMKFELFKNDDFVFFMINLEMPESTRLEQTEKAIELVEEHLLGLPKNFIEAVVTRVGFIEDVSTGQMKYGSGKAQIVVDLTESAVRPGISGKDIMDLSRKNFPEIPGMMSIEFQEDRGGPPVGSALTFRIMAEDYPTILKISEEVQSYLRTVPGLKDIKDDFEWGKEEFRIDVDERRAADLGISVAEVAREVRNAFAGGLATTFTRGEEEVEIHVKFTEGYRSSPENIRIMKFRNDKGEMVPFDSFARVDYGRSFSSIQRWNQKRTVTVTADVDGVHITSRGINQMMQDRYGNVSKDHAGVLFDYGGEEEDSQESMAALGRAFALAMLINYGIIATIFNSVMQPFVVM